jgi:BirA family biotin operon repressor/biotin-[acetyl-CoA-carboxylase] ligase
VSFDREWIIHQYGTLPTTMDRAALLARAGARDRTAVVSAAQTAGRGRGERSWQSAGGEGLYCTLILRPGVSADRLSTLSLIVGVAVADAIAKVTGCQPRLKWPNDVWLGDDPRRQKVAGILLSSSFYGQDVGSVLVGIGINLSAPADRLPEGATSLLAATGLQTTAGAVLDLVLKCIDRHYHAYLSAEGRPSLDGWRARAALLGESVSIEDGSRQLSGTFVGIDDDGALLLEDRPGHVSRIVAGDLTRGPRRIG